ncbi:hypothetical protein GCM10023189_30840 [Nibrella saemangeumensis]|uniref:Spheroidene monooxygenase n=1 Tax=Nibrella saemangeumensis TaxID=1084526 RepID=A0ABP8N1W8_9BACT
MKASVVTFTILRYHSGQQYHAFANIGRWMMKPFSAGGLRFQKMMGSGRGFGLIPDFSTYVFLAVWDNEQAARSFFQADRWQQYSRKAAQTGTLWMEPIKSHGQWSGENPFAPEQAQVITPNLPVAVLTRATIRTGALLDFWRHVPQARSRLGEQPNLLFSIGVGEKPLVQQCTVSVWRNAAAIDQFAYRQSGHKEIVKATRQRRWYTEELFARFSVRSAEGSIFTTIDQLVKAATFPTGTTLTEQSAVSAPDSK